MANFNDSIKVILKHEGGYVNNPSDPGGETKYGISKARFPNVDIYNLTKLQAKDIYFEHWWKKFALGKIKSQPIATQIFDILVLHGQGARIIQRTVNSLGGGLVVDNRFGPNTLKAVNKTNPDVLNNSLIENRIAYMQKLGRENHSLSQFVKGWVKRANSFGNIIPGGLITIAIPIGVAIILYKVLGKKLNK